MRKTSTAPLVTWSREFPAVPDQAREARRFLASILDGREASADAVLCLSELITNATVHSKSRQPGGLVTVRAQLRGPELRVEVHDQGGPWPPDTHPNEALHQRGRGLLIVGGLACRWGRAGDATSGWSVWFEMACPLSTRSPQQRAKEADRRWIVVVDGRRLRQFRRQHKLSQEQLAAKAGISSTTVARLERRSQAACRSRTLARLAAAMGEQPTSLAVDGCTAE